MNKDLEARLIPNKNFSHWKKIPILGTFAGGGSEYKTEQDGSERFVVVCRGFELEPGAGIRVLINKELLFSESTFDGRSFKIKKFSRDNEELPYIEIGSTITVEAAGETMFTGVYEED